MSVTLNSCLGTESEQNWRLWCDEGYEGADGDYFAYVLQIVRENNFWIELSICSESFRTEDLTEKERKK